MHGIKGITYSDQGLWDKESQKLFEMINQDVSKKQIEKGYRKLDSGFQYLLKLMDDMGVKLDTAKPGAELRKEFEEGRNKRIKDFRIIYARSNSRRRIRKLF